MTEMKRKPRVFIGSSAEGLPVAKALQVGLDHSAEVTIWSQGVFGLSRGTLEDLVRASQTFDYAVLALTPDDLLHKRTTVGNSPRDNVIFELGLFMGALGRERTFIVYSRDAKPELPSDLAGVTAATYGQRLDGNLQAAVGAACTQIENAISAHEAATAGPNIKLGLRRDGEGFVIAIEAQNDMPFECKFIAKLENNTIISGIPLEWTRIVPTPQQRLFYWKERFNKPAEKIVVRFSARGIFDPAKKVLPSEVEIVQTYDATGPDMVLLHEESKRVS